MARRRTKKERKKHLKEDQFRDTMLNLGKGFKEYRYLILLSAAVVTLLIVLLSIRAERRGENIAYATEMIKRGANVGPEELSQLVEKVKGEPIEPWIMIRYGTKLFDLYQKEDSLKGDRTRLEEARKVFKEITTRFPHNGSAAFVARKSLDLIEKEMLYEPPEALKKAFARATNPTPTPTPRPPNVTPPKVPPRRPSAPKTPDRPGRPDAPKPPPGTQPPSVPEKAEGAPKAPVQPGSTDAPAPPSEKKQPAKPGDTGATPAPAVPSGEDSQDK